MKISYLPWQEIVIHELRKHEEDGFFELVATQIFSPTQMSPYPTVNWAHGIGFVFGVFADTDEVIREKLAGKVHYTILNYARTKFAPEVKINVGGKSQTIRMVNVESVPDFVDLVKFLKKFKQPAP